MNESLVIIGIDSLDPYLLKKFQSDLPNFSAISDASSTFVSKSVFPVDTIPAWMTIFTGLSPANHGILYTYDIFDPQLMNLKKIDIETMRGKFFWDIANKAGLKTNILFPNLIYPSYEINGIMITKSPFERQINWIQTEIDLDVTPESVKTKYALPNTIENLWGGFPGEKNLHDWAILGKSIVKKEAEIGLEIINNEVSDIFFIYFSLLDIIQHRLWKYFDTSDPLYIKESEFSGIIHDYYILFDRIVGQFVDLESNCKYLVISDHGHKQRPTKTVNINEYLRKKHYLVSKRRRDRLQVKIRELMLNMIRTFHLEPFIVKILSKNERFAKSGKAIYSSEGMINKPSSHAFLSNFAGVKSYPFGGIEINKDLVSQNDYYSIRAELIESLKILKDNSGTFVFQSIEERETKVPGMFSEQIYPDILFELSDGYGVGWDLHTNIFGEAHDHSVASGGHRKEGVILTRNIKINPKKIDINIMDIFPTILQIFNVECRTKDLNGESILDE